jgi:AraC-like DNA-binding protein
MKTVKACIEASKDHMAHGGNFARIRRARTRGSTPPDRSSYGSERLPHPRSTDGAPATVAIAIMRAHLAETLTLREIAAEVHLSVYYFVRVFHKATGETPYRFLARLRMELAQQLLTDTALTMAHIAERCGFSGPSSFSSAFLRHVGIRPSTYRKNHNQQQREAASPTAGSMPPEPAADHARKTRPIGKPIHRPAVCRNSS